MFTPVKTFAIVLAWLAFANTVRAQKENNVWVGGQLSGIDFNSGSPVVFERGDNALIWRANASICDSAGDLLFYTNGYRVFNRNYDVMPNGDGLDIGDMLSFGNEMLADNNAVAITPVPGSPEKYYVFHYDNNYTSVGPDSLQNMLMPTHLFSCVVDMNLDGGNGDLVMAQRDVVLLADTLTSCGLNLAKHANGRDYWLIAHEYGSDRYYRFLVDPYGIHGPNEQHIGPVIGGIGGLGFSTLQFNAEDDNVAQLMSEYTTAWIYDFDRCAGEFVNPNAIEITSGDSATLTGAFSPSGRYFYATAGSSSIWQFDLEAADIESSRQCVAHYSGAMNPFEADYAEMELAPDNKIYVNAWAANNSLHVINNPDSAGEACGFVDNGLQLNPPGWDWAGMPNTVHHKLGPVTGSGCDTLTSTKGLMAPTFTFSVYPNPFVKQFQLSITGVTTNAFLSVTNVLGQRVLQQTLTPIDRSIHQVIDLSHCAAGVYLVTMDVNNNRYTQRVVKR